MNKKKENKFDFILNNENLDNNNMIITIISAMINR